MQNIKNNPTDASEQNFNFGFDGEEFEGAVKSVPYAQFLNASSSVYGLAITKNNAELAGFVDNKDYSLIDHQFDDGTRDRLYLTQNPRLIVINRSEPLMGSETQTIPYDKVKYQEGGWKAFSYAIIWPVDVNNQPLSQMPFRIKCSGFAGITFLKNYSYYNNPDSFSRKFLAVYKALTGDRVVEKNDIFYAHAVYQIELVREQAKSSQNNQSSMAVQTRSFLEPTRENFGSLIIRNGSDFSNKIKAAIEETKGWLKTTPVDADLNGVTVVTPVIDEGVRNPSQTKEGGDEYAQLIINDSRICGWSDSTLEAFLSIKYNCTVDRLGDLPETRLIQIYGAIQDPAIISMFNADPSDEPPF
jgi:Family of unknown function (DUF5895)